MTRIIYAIDVEGIVEPTQGFALEIDKALDDETHYARSRHKILAAAAT